MLISLQNVFLKSGALYSFEIHHQIKNCVFKHDATEAFYYLYCDKIKIEHPECNKLLKFCFQQRISSVTLVILNLIYDLQLVCPLTKASSFESSSCKQNLQSGPPPHKISLYVFSVGIQALKQLCSILHIKNIMFILILFQILQIFQFA